MTFDLNYVVLALIAILLILLIILMIRFQLIEKYFAPLRFRIQNQLVIDPNLNKEFLKLAIFNSTLNDAKVTSFGYVYRQKNIDFFREYLTQANLPFNQQTMVPSRDSITFTLPLESLADVVQNINDGKFRVKTIKVFAMSSFGQVTIFNAKIVRKHLSKVLRKRDRLEQERLAGIRRENRRIRREKRQRELAILRQRIGFWFQKTLLGLKNLFKKQKS